MARENDVAKRLQIIPAANFVLHPCGPPQSTHLQPVIVTLDRRRDRWEKVVRELAKIGISRVAKFSAVDGAMLSAEAIARLLDSDCVMSDLPTSHTQLTRPAIGCFLSHLQIWQAFVASGNDGNERLVILEDDVVPAPAYSAARAQLILSSVPPQADLVLLGCTIMAGLAEKTEMPFLSRVYYFNGTYAYLISRKGCLHLLQHLLPMRAHIDHQISDALIRHRGSLFAYAAMPNLFDHDFSSWSDAYIPLAANNEADRQLDAVLRSARAILRTDSSITLNEE